MPVETAIYFDVYVINTFIHLCISIHTWWARWYTHIFLSIGNKHIDTPIHPTRRIVSKQRMAIPANVSFGSWYLHCNTIHISTLISHRSMDKMSDAILSIEKALVRFTGGNSQKSACYSIYYAKQLQHWLFRMCNRTWHELNQRTSAWVTHSPSSFSLSLVNLLSLALARSFFAVFFLHVCESLPIARILFLSPSLSLSVLLSGSVVLVSPARACTLSLSFPRPFPLFPVCR